MKKNTILKIISIFGAIIILFGGIFIFFSQSSVLGIFLEKVVIVYSFSGVLITVIWHGINRLNSLDNLDGLKAEHIKLIQSETSETKRSLYFRVIWLFLSTFVLFICSAMRSLSPFVDIALSIVLPIVLTIIWVNAINFASLYISIDEYRQKVNDLCQKENARRKLIDEMKKDRQEHPLKPDQHLEGYKNIFNEHL